MSCARMMAALATPGLSPVQRLIYATIVGFSDGGVCRTSLRAIAEHLHRPDRSGVLKVIKELAAQLLIEIAREQGVNEYRLLDPKVWSSAPQRRGRENHTPVVVSTTPVVITTTPQDPVGVVPTTTPNGGNQPIPELGPRACVDSESSLKEEGSKKGRERAKALSARENEPSGFAEFYLAYPRKVGRPSAAKAFAKATKRGATLETIMEGLRRYRFNSDPEFRPHPATWLNDDRWKVEAPPPRQTAQERMATYL